MKNRTRGLLAATVLAAFAGTGWAAPLVLDFEGTTSGGRIGDHYSQQGVRFGSNAQALSETDADANFSNAPSPGTVMFFGSGGGAVMNVANGFADSVAFFYSTTFDAAFVNIWSGENASGDLLGTYALAALGSGDDADDPYNVWALASLSFDGIARSIDFGGTANRVGFDDITLGSAPTAAPQLVAQQEVPEAPTLALALAALTALGVVRRRAG